MKKYQLKLKNVVFLSLLLVPILVYMFSVIYLSDMVTICLCYGSEKYFAEGLRMVNSKHCLLSNGERLPGEWITIRNFICGFGWALGFLAVYLLDCLVRKGSLKPDRYEEVPQNGKVFFYVIYIDSSGKEHRGLIRARGRDAVQFTMEKLGYLVTCSRMASKSEITNKDLQLMENDEDGVVSSGEREERD